MKFNNNDTVVIHSTGDETLDGMFVRVVGMVGSPQVTGTIYIVESLLKNVPLTSEWNAIPMTESCLCRTDAFADDSKLLSSTVGMPAHYAANFG